MTGVERGLWIATLLATLLGVVAFGVAYRPDLAVVSAALGAYLSGRAPLGWALMFGLASAAAYGASAFLGRSRPIALPGNDGPPISPVAVVDARVATAVQDVIAKLSVELREIASHGAEPDMVVFVDRLLRGAISVGASDVHLHPVESGTHVSFRVHGVLGDIMTFPREHHARLVARVKVLGRLVSYRTDRPQDGHFVLESQGGTADIRISVLPTNHGEKVVLRIARVGLDLPDLSELGFPVDLLETYQRILSKPQGLVFLTGPTGSGKTTTIYASLAHIKRVRGETTQIATIEDPIEFNVPFLTQTQVNPHVDLTFAKGLRSILRQDPNVIMVGEIRDAETAHIAVQSGLTGHQIVTTVHADSAAGAFNRLIEMGVEPFLLASASLASLSQRLVRAACPHCKEPVEAEAHEMERLKSIEALMGPYYRGRGCERCDRTGYLGRIALYEILEVSPAIRELMNQKVPTNRIHQHAVQEGMRPLLAHGVARALAGETTLSEVLRVAG